MNSQQGQIKKQNPKDKANFFSIAIFGYVVPLLWKGYREDLGEEDIYEVTKDLESKLITDRLEKHWEFLKFNTRRSSLIKLLLTCYGKRYFIIGIIQLIIECSSSIIRPLAVAKLVHYFVPGQSEISIEEAYFYAGTVLIIMVVSSFSDAHLSLSKTVLALEIRMAFSSLIYRKALKLHPSVLTEMSTGKIVTLITKDLQAVDMAVHFANDLWIEMIIGIFIGYLIYQKVGLAALVILISMIIIFPVQGTFGYAVFKQRKVANKRSDARIQLTQEALSVIRVIKMYTWENFFCTRIDDARKEEIKSIRTLLFLKQGGLFMGEIISKLGYNLILIVYLLLGNNLSPQVVYYVATSYQKLRFILTYLITLSLSEIGELLASFKRIEILFNAEEFQHVRQPKKNYMSCRILMRNVDVKIKETQILIDITFNLEPGLNVIIGPVGSGKTTLMNTILHEYKISSGSLIVNGEISYACQQPWLFPASIRQNILFGAEYNQERYERILEVCALNLDLKLFPLGDRTIVTESGANLSKGQQARVNLARAIYRESDIYILDDCFSALDVNVQNYIFKNCIRKFLVDKLIVLVTHNGSFATDANHVIILNAGKITYSGKPDEVTIRNNINEFGPNSTHDDKIEAESNEQIVLSNGKAAASPKEGSEKIAKSNNIYSEDMKSGKIGMDVYKRYILYGGLVLFIFLLCLHIAVESLNAITEKLVSKWVNEQKDNSTSSTLEEQQENSERTMKAIILLSALSLGAVVAKFGRAIVHFVFAMRVSRNMHRALINNVINANVKFFDTNLLGNILNRFSRDLGLMDEYLPHVISEVMRMTFMTISTVGLVVSVNMTFLYLSILFFIVMIVFSSFFMPAARSLRRLEAVSRSPMIGHLNSTIEGLVSVRAFKQQNLLKQEFDFHQNYNISAQFVGMISWKLLQLYCHMLCAIFVSSILGICLFFKSSFKAGDVGLSLTTAVALGMQLQWGIRNLINLESTMTCVERTLEYIDEPQESKTGKKKKNWPSKGSISFEKVNLTYSLNAKPVLKNVNFRIAPGEKIGVVGRTGAGKSSIIVALYRFYTISGEIDMDDENIAKISLPELRRAMSIIPQEPVIFSGNIRSNIDPAGQFTDNEIWEALKTVNLKGVITNLDSLVDPKTSGFSLGQKQLISIARAVVRNTKIVILDEATANMDNETEKEINAKIKEIFKERTLLIIAHRMETILDCDKVIVMDKGEVVEFDNPLTLVSTMDSKFRQIVQKAGALRDYLKRIEAANI